MLKATEVCFEGVKERITGDLNTIVKANLENVSDVVTNVDKNTNVVNEICDMQQSIEELKKPVKVDYESISIQGYQRELFPDLRS